MSTFASSLLSLVLILIAAVSRASDSQIVWQETPSGARCAEHRLLMSKSDDDRWQQQFEFVRFVKRSQCVARFGQPEYFSSRSEDGTYHCGQYTPVTAGLIDSDGRAVRRRILIQFVEEVSQCDPNRRIEFTRSEDI